MLFPVFRVKSPEGIRSRSWKIELGWRIETTMIGGVPGFEIAGYPRALLDEFSSRRREILAWLDAHGLPYRIPLNLSSCCCGLTTHIHCPP